MPPTLSPITPLPTAEAWMEKPSFGKPLEEHLAVSGREIAFPVEACVTMLLECGMQEEVGAGGQRPGHLWWHGDKWPGRFRGRAPVPTLPVSSAKGLFRVAPSASKLKKLKAALDCCVVDVQEYSADPHAIAGGDRPGFGGFGVSWS